jgi:hypothetical protein
MLARPALLPGEADIARVADYFGAGLPRTWVSWVSECGIMTGYGRALLGLNRRDAGGGTSGRTDALDVLMLLRLSEPDFPPDLLPVEILPERQLHCLVVSGADQGRIVLIDLDRPGLRVLAAASLQDFVSQWQQDLHAMAAVVSEVLSSDESDEAVLLRPDEWSTRRLCTQNVIVALLQTRHNRDTNEHDVAVCATASLTSFAAGAPARWALTTILTEAYQAGGSLAVNFVRRARRPEKDGGGFEPFRVSPKAQYIPLQLAEWATAHGVPLQRRDGRWDHETGERLLLAATRMPDSLRALIPEMAVSPATVCAAITTGTWPALDAEYVLRTSDDPLRILAGQVGAADRLRYVADQQVVRNAIVLSALLRHLERSGQPSASDEDDTIRRINVDLSAAAAPGVDRTLRLARYSADDGETLAIGWPRLGGAAPAYDTEHAVGVRVLCVEADVLAATGPAVVMRMEAGEILIVAADALAAAPRLTELIAAARVRGVRLLAGPEYTTTLDVAIAVRLNRARMSRQ